jgi:aryl-alcohol dehydrogenase-like predicted oxidoreductase
MRMVEIAGLPRISRMGLGTWQFGSGEWGYGDAYAEREASRIVTRALDLGVTLFDTAEAYGFGRSERILGAAVAGRRDEAYLATKWFPLVPLPGMVQRHGRASAARLGTPRIDLYQVHQPNPFALDSVVMGGMRELQDAGTVVDVGVSNYSLGRWRRAEEALGRRVLSNQVRYSLVDRGPEAELLPYARANDRLVIAWSPLAQGFLSARYDEDHRPAGAVRRANPVFLAENLRAARPLFGVLREVAAAHDATPAQVSLAWLLHQPNVLVIPGASSVEQLEANVAAADLVLAADEVAALRAAAEAFRPVGGLAAAPRVVAGWRTG